MSNSHPLVTVKSGTLKGTNLPGEIRRFLGVPYAAPPIGELRWKPPQTVLSWDGERDANKFGPSCIQKEVDPNSLYYGGETLFSEDCLYLNIWTGSAQSVDRPVLVFLHFGAHQFGSASNPLYDGRKLAESGITVVTLNWRLGRFGFFAHPELTAESSHRSSGNYGFLDQIAALEWVQQNINAFGGNAHNVTLAGVSAGGNSVHSLRSSTLAKGLFAKAVAMSGSGVAPPARGLESSAQLNDLAYAEAAGVELAQHLGVKTAAELRQVPADDILKTTLPRAKGYWSFGLMPNARISLAVFDTSYPIVDGYVLKKTPLEALLCGDVHDTPMIASNTGNEASGLPRIESLPDFDDYLRKTFQISAQDIDQPYSAVTHTEAQSASWDLIQDQTFIWPTWTAARLQARKLSAPAWYSRFLHTPPIPERIVEHRYAKSFHAADVPYAFGNLHKLDWNWEEADKILSQRIMQSLINFLRFDNPDPDGKLDWPAMQLGNEVTKIWDLEPRTERFGPHPRRMSFLDRHYNIESE